MQEEIDEMFHSLIEELKESLPDLGEHLVVDANYELPLGYKLTKASAIREPLWRELTQG